MGEKEFKQISSVTGRQMEVGGRRLGLQGELRRKEVRELGKALGVDGITVEMLSGVDDVFMQLGSYIHGESVGVGV